MINSVQCNIKIPQMQKKRYKRAQTQMMHLLCVQLTLVPTSASHDSRALIRLIPEYRVGNKSRESQSVPRPQPPSPIKHLFVCKAGSLQSRAKNYLNNYYLYSFIICCFFFLGATPSLGSVLLALNSGIMPGCEPVTS